MGIKEDVRKKVKKFEEGLQNIFSLEESRRKPLIIQRDILDAIELKIELKDRARPVFPFDHLHIQILALTAEERAALEAVLIDGGTLVEQIRDRLGRNDVPVPVNFKVDFSFVDTPSPNWDERFFNILYLKQGRVTKIEEKAPSGLNKAEIVVLAGKATRKRYPLNQSLFNIGRLAEVTDEHGRPLRRNHLAFIEEGDELEDNEREINKTVGREHAHIRFDDQVHAFRLYVDRGDNGTRIFRDGEITKVTRTNIKGRKLQSGDVIYFGKASVRFEAKHQDPPPAPRTKADTKSSKATDPKAQKRGRTTRPQ